MAFLGGILGDILKPVTGIIDKAVVDVDKKKELKFRLKELADRTDQRYHDELMGQVEINKIEAAHPSIFVAGWRPSIGWVTSAGIAYNFVVGPLLDPFVTGQMVQLDTGPLLTLALSMIGIRQWDKHNKTDTTRMGD